MSWQGNMWGVSLRRVIWLVALIIFVFLPVPLVRGLFFDRIGRWLYILLFSFSTAAFLIPLIAFLAARAGVVDRPGGRKIHLEVTPLLGGAAVMISFLSALLANMILDSRELAIMAGGTVVALVGFLDDWIGVRARYKLLVQVAAVIFLMRSGIILDLFPTWAAWGYFLNVSFSILWIVGLTNAMNFIDGMDGLAAGVSAIISLFMAIVAFQTSQPFVGWIAISMLGSCLGFLPFNFHLRRPAAIFLGDGGSTFCGFILSALAIKADWADNNPIVSFATPVLIFWVLIYDMAYITVERILTGKVKSFQQWLDYVGNDHIHHRLLAVLEDRRKVVAFIFFLCATLGLSAITLRNARPIDGILLVVQAFFITVIVSILEYSHRKNCK